MSAPHAKGLFRATGNVPYEDTPREEHDFYPTPPDATRAFLAVEGRRLRDFPGIWEPAAGDGAMVREMEAQGFSVHASDLIDRGCGAWIEDFYSVRSHANHAIVTNPPYSEINARDGHGRWLAHAFEIGAPYQAYLLNWDWPAAVKNGLGELLAWHPISRVYLCRWKIDFTGKGSPPQRNAWFVWDYAHKGETVMRFLDRADGRQAELFAEPTP